MSRQYVFCPPCLPNETTYIHISKLLQVNNKARSLSEQPDRSMLARLRVLEQKMGLVLTLVFLSSPLWRQKHEFP